MNANTFGENESQRSRNETGKEARRYKEGVTELATVL